MSKSMNARLREEPKIDHRLKMCPFCGAPAAVQYWHGGKPTKRMVSCSNAQCEVGPQVTGETYREAANHWDTRA